MTLPFEEWSPPNVVPIMEFLDLLIEFEILYFISVVLKFAAAAEPRA